MYCESSQDHETDLWPLLNRRNQAAPAKPAGLADDEKRAFDRLDFFFKHGLAYAQEMGSRPQTLYAIADSPVGLAAWFLEKFNDWTDSGGDAEKALTPDLTRQG